MDESAAITTVGVGIEHASLEQQESTVADLQTPNVASPAFQVVAAIHHALRPDDLAVTRVIFTGDLVQSVNDREDRTDRPYTIERGAGVVAAKTMPPDQDGVVDILVPLFWLGPFKSQDETAEAVHWIRHIAAHEAIHATLFHIGDDPFDAHLRKEFGAATAQFVVLASELIEEHLAEYLATSSGAPGATSTAESLRATFDAFSNALTVELPAVSVDEPDYFAKGMQITFEALHIVWKTLAYLAAEVRSEQGFAEVETGIRLSEPWRVWVDPWWEEFTHLLSLIPATTDVDVAATDQVVVALARHLQAWALGLGFDYHDANGRQDAFFRITLWD